MKQWIAMVATGLVVLSCSSPLVAEASFHTSHVSTGHSGGFHSSGLHTGGTHINTSHYHGTIHQSSGSRYHVKSALPKHSTRHSSGLKPAKFKKTYKLSNKPVKKMNRREQSRLLKTSHVYSQKTSNHVFSTNHLGSSYQHGFYRQSIITNPWFWMFMYEHHRLNQDSQHDNDYLMGYRDGAKDAKGKLKSHQKNAKSGKTPVGSTASYDNGYRDGFKDVMSSKK